MKALGVYLEHFAKSKKKISQTKRFSLRRCFAHSAASRFHEIRSAMNHPRSRLVRDQAPLFLLASFALFWFSYTVTDPDLWGHIRFGQDILRTRSIVQSDAYSYRSAGQTWINHEWLAEVAFAGIYDRAGPSGLIVAKVFLSVVLAGFCQVRLTRRGLGHFRAVFLLILASVPFRMGLGTIRPQIFTYLAFLLVLLLLERAKTGRELYLWALPVIVLVWVNLHGGVLAGIGVVGLWVGVRTVESLRNRNKQDAVASLRLLALLTVCGLALLVNPYGARLVTFLVTTGTVPRPEISEWVPLALLSLPGLIYLSLLAIGIIGLAGSSRPRRSEAIVIVAVAAALPLLANRHYPLFVLTLVVFGGAHIADTSNRWSLAAWSGFARSRFGTAACLLASLLMIGFSLPRFGCIRVDPYYFPFPARAVALLKQSGARGNMAVPFDWGEYVLWHLGPGIKVSIDGRRETLYSDEAYRQSVDFEQGRGVWDALLKTSSTDLVLAQNASPAANLLSLTEKWIPLYQDSYCVLFARAGLPSIDQIVKTPVPRLPDNGDGLCFPAPGGGNGRSIRGSHSGFKMSAFRSSS